MAQISRVHTAEIQDGEDILADLFNEEFDPIINESNSQDTRITTLENTAVLESGTNTFTGSNTFSSVLNSTGRTNLARSSDPTPQNGDIWYNSTSNIFKVRSNGVTRPVAFIGGFNAQTGTTYTVLSTDRNHTITFNSASPVAVTLPQANSTGFTDGFSFRVKNIGAGDVTITPTTSTIDGDASLILLFGQSVDIESNNTNYFSFGGKQDPVLEIKFQDQQTSGTNGGNFTTGAPRTRVVNTKVTDETGLASVSSNQMTLPAGEYLIDASAPATACDGHYLLLYNVTAGTTLCTGSGAHSSSTTQTRAFLSDKFTVAAGQALELRHECKTTRNTDGLGTAMNISGKLEIFADIRFVKIA